MMCVSLLDDGTPSLKAARLWEGFGLFQISGDRRGVVAILVAFCGHSVYGVVVSSAEVVAEGDAG
jgi:hypothetical protein